MSTRFASNHLIRLNLKTILNTIFIILLVIIFLNPQVSARADTSVCGQITSNTTWSPANNNYIVTCLVQVMPGVTLTIESGTQVLFNDGTALRIDGELIAQGVTFSSSNASPSKGIWAQIYFTTTSEDAVFNAQGDYVSGSILQDSLVEWGGGGTGVLGAVNIAGASPFLDNNNILYSSTRGIYAVGRSSSQMIHFAGNTVSNNDGGGIYVSDGELNNNVVSNNSGGGVSATNSLLSSNEVIGNAGGSGAGIYAKGCVLNNNIISGNYADPCVNPYGVPCYPIIPPRYGGGVYANGSELNGNLISGNRVGNHYDDDAFGGGVYAIGGTLTGNTVTGNVITSGGAKGGGIYSSLSVLTGNDISSNSVNGHNSSGGGIYVDGGSVSDNTISGNTVNCAAGETSYGGGIYANGGTVTNNTVNDNSAAGGDDNQGGGIYGSVNTISDNILSGNSARRGSAIYSNKGTVQDNTVTNNTTSWTGSIYVYEGTAIGNLLQENTAVNGGGIFGYQATISGNTLENNTANVGGGILSSQSTVRGNTLTGNVATGDGGGIAAEGGVVTNNTLTSNSVPSYGHGSGAYLVGVAEFSYNDVLSNTAPGGTAGGISVDGQPVVQYNNLYGNTPYDAEIVSADFVTGTLNYWGLSACSAIPSQIYDGKDAPGRGLLSYTPSLYSPVPVAQLDAPTNLAMDEDETTAALSWEAIPPLPDVGCQVPASNESKIGYRVYYGNAPCGPFDGMGLPEGDSPIDVGNNTTFNLTGLSGQAIYFAVTAYDYLGRESHFTNVVGKPGQGYWIFLPVTRR